MLNFKILISIILFSLNLYSNEVYKKQSPHLNNNINTIDKKYDFESSYGFPSNNSLLSTFKDARIAIAVWIDDLGRNHGGKLDVKFFDNINVMYSEYKKDNGLDMIVVDLPFYFKHKNEIKKLSNNFWSVSFDENNHIQYYFVANKKSNINSFKDIKDKSVALRYQEKGSSDWLNKNSYISNKLPYRDIVKNSVLERKESTALLKVFFNKVDFTIVSSRTWNKMFKANPSIKDKVEIVKKSKRIYLPFIGFFSKKTKKNGVDAFFHLCNDMKKGCETKQMIDLLRFNTIFKVSDDSLFDLEKCYLEYFHLRKDVGFK